MKFLNIPSARQRASTAKGTSRIARVLGFTLIELLIVIVIMGLLLSLVAPAMFSKVGSSQKKTAMAQMQMLSTALDTYRLDVGAYPKTLAE
jgi:general secretion pathway protein G